jgi:hypothetical protein
MKPKLQFSRRNVLIATAWAAVFCANWVLARRSPSYQSLLDGYLMAGLIYVPPSAMVGALAGRHLLGVCCGLAGIAALFLWSEFDPIFVID